MRRAARTSVVLGCLAALGANTGVWAQDQAMAQLESLARTLRSETAWRADFDQEYIPAGMTMGEDAAGRVWLAWPDHALFHTGAPVVRLMGLQGRVARLVDLDAETCDEHHLSDREWERVPLAAVLDPRGALEHFTVMELGARGFVLVPREPGGVNRVEVVVGASGLPDEVAIWDPQGAVNRFRFAGWEASTHPPEEAWLPAAPEGIECVADLGAYD